MITPRTIMWIHGLYVILPLLFNTTRLLSHGWMTEDGDTSSNNTYYPYWQSTYQEPNRNYSHDDTLPYQSPYVVNTHTPIADPTPNYTYQYYYYSNENPQFGFLGDRPNDLDTPFPVDMALIASNWPLFYSNFCGRVCRNGTLVLPVTDCPSPECFPCECGERCVARGTCCPSLYQTKNTATIYNELEYFNKNHIRDAFERARCNRLTKGNMFLTVSTCPSAWDDRETRQICEKPKGDSLTSLTYYNDLDTGLVFRNIYCALCNGFYFSSNTTNRSYIDFNVVEFKDSNSKRLRIMEFKVECADYNRLSYITDPFKFFKVSTSLDECNLSFKDTKNAISCSDLFADDDRPIIRTCPVEANQTLKDLCHNLPPLPALKILGDRNIFCLLCLGKSLTTFNLTSCISDGYPGYGSPPTTLLFSTSRTGDDQDPSIQLAICGTREWEDTQGQCLKVLCPPGKVIVNENRCEQAFDEIRGLVYRLRTTLRSITDLPKGLQNRFIELFSSTVVGKIRHAKLSFSVRHSMCVLGNDRGENEMEMELNAVIYAPMSMSRDEFENQTLRVMFSNPWDMPILDDSGNIHNVSLHTVCVGKDVCAIYHKESKIDNKCVVAQKTFDFDNENVSTTVSSNIKQEMLPILSCPYVALDLVDDPRVVDRKLKVVIDLNGQKGRVTWVPSSMSYEKGKIHMCVQVYNNIDDLFEENKPTPNTLTLISMAHYYLDVVCLFVSCALLLVSIITYLIFPCLRTVPGLNTLCLCLSLFTAQLSLLVTSLFGSNGFLPDNYCIVHGIVLHYSWVSSFVWMNTCCIHTYRVFTGIKIKYKLRNFTWYCVYSFGLPVLVVVVLILTTTLATGGKSIGYDKHICFLDTTTSSLILIMGLLAPLLFSVTSNGVLFTLTIKTIVSMTRMRQQPKSSHGVVTYVKLSAVTGFFCLFTATAIQFNNPILSLIASPFAALQGGFIFVSFIANRRVYKRYINLISNKKQPTDSFQTESNFVTTSKF